MPSSPMEPYVTVYDGGAAPLASASAAMVPSEPPQLDRDGNDDRPSAQASLPDPAVFERVGRHAAALERVCDMVARDDALYMAHATSPLRYGGATVTRHTPRGDKPFSLVFDWNRPGEPEKGGGAAGQGFLRLRRFGGRFYVPDADPPYLGFGFSRSLSEGYVFVSDAAGGFERARRPNHLPPLPPSEERGGAIVLPGALHVFDVIRFRGKFYASTGAVVPPDGKRATSPGTLYVSGSNPGRWEIAYTYPPPTPGGAVRLGYMVRFRDRLLVAISHFDRGDPNDLVVIAPPAGATDILPEHARAVRATPSGSAHTLRFYVNRGTLYWISYSGGAYDLYSSTDGEHVKRIELPAEAGSASDVLRVGETLLVLTERALLELAAGGIRVRAKIDGKRSPFAVDDLMCGAPLSVFDGALYAGGQRRGELYKLVAARE
jgi:hypothetical protein